MLREWCTGVRLAAAFVGGVGSGWILKACVRGSLRRRAGGEDGASEAAQAEGTDEGINYLPFLNGLLYMGIAAFAGERQVENLLYYLCAPVLLGIAVVDEKTREIPPGYSLFLGGLGLVRSFLHLSGWQEHLAGLFAVSSLLLAGFVMTDGKGAGGGDIKLMAAAGLFLGWEKVLWAFLVGGILGVVSCPFRKRTGSGKREIALGPYLVTGILTVMVLQ